MNIESIYGLFDQMSDGVCLSDASGNILYMNPAAGRLLDLTQAEGRHLRNSCDLLCGHLELASGKTAAAGCPLRDPTDSTRAVTYEGRHGPRSTFNWRDDRVNRSQTWKNLRVRCAKTRVPLSARLDEELHLVLIEDDSVSSELRRHREDWRSMIAHDLRQPLTAVYSALKILEEIHPQIPGRHNHDHETQIVQTSLRACSRMMELLDLYLDVARLDAGAAEVEVKPLDAAKLLDDVVDEQSSRASVAGVMIELDAEPGVTAMGDSDLLLRVFANLLDNAVKYNVRGGSVKITAKTEGGAFKVSFKDTGKGIPSDALPFIFDRYFQAAARRAGRIKGNGLGLTFVREALKTMGAVVDVESRLGEGSEFVVTLQAAAVSSGKSS
jgi:signal transduction histidine kinase